MATPSSADRRGRSCAGPQIMSQPHLKICRTLSVGRHKTEPACGRLGNYQLSKLGEKRVMDKQLTWLVGWGRNRRTRRRGKVRDRTLKQTSSIKTDMRSQRGCGLHFNCRVIHNVPQVESVLEKPIPIVSFVKKKSHRKNGGQ